MASCQFPSWSPDVPLCVTVWWGHHDEFPPWCNSLGGYHNEMAPWCDDLGRNHDELTPTTNAIKLITLFK